MDRVTVLWLMAPPDAPDLEEVMRRLVDRPAWHDRAACRDADTDLFFPTVGQKPKQAMALCSQCPVQWSCRQAAMADPLMQGVWGGTTERERRRQRSSSSDVA